MSSLSLTGNSYAHLLTNAKSTGMYICKNSGTGEREVFQIKKGFIPQSFRELILDGYRVLKDLQKKPDEARKVVDVLKLKCDRKKAKSAKEKLLIRVVMLICDCLRNLVGGLGFKSSVKLAENLIAKLEKCAGPAPAPIKLELPLPSQPPSQQSSAPSSPKRAFALPKPKNPQEAPSDPRLKRVKDSSPLISAAPDLEVPRETKPKPKPVNKPKPVLTPPSKQSKPSPLRRSQSTALPQPVVPQTPATPTKLPKWDPPTPEQRDPGTKHIKKPKVIPNLFATGKQMETYKESLAKRKENLENGKDEDDSLRLVKQTIVMTIKSAAIEMDPKTKMPKDELSVESLIHEMTDKKTIDLNDSVAGYVIVDTFQMTDNDHLAEALAEWLSLSKQTTFHMTLLSRCFDVFIKKSIALEVYSKDALMTLLKIYVDKKWQFKTTDDLNLLNNVIATVICAYTSKNQATLEKITQVMIDRPEFDFSTFVKCVSAFKYRIDELSTRAKKRVDDLEYGVLRKLLERFKNTPEWHSLLKPDNPTVNSNLDFALAQYKAVKALNSMTSEKLKKEFLNFIVQKSKDLGL